jgi:DNA mismatch repair ATPase MutS
MNKNYLLRIKNGCASLFGSKNKKVEERLKTTFGKVKDDTFDFEYIEDYFRNKDHSTAQQVLSEKTCNDLDIDELFMFIDRTYSKVGQQYLYNKLREINQDDTQNQLNEEIIGELCENIELRLKTQKLLEQLSHKDAYYINTLFQKEHLKPPKWFFAIQLLSFTSVVSFVLCFFQPVFFIVLMGTFCVNFIIHYYNKKNLVQYVSSIPQLLKLNAVASHLFVVPIFKKLHPELSQSIGIIKEVKRRLAFFQFEAKLQGEFEILAWFVFEIIKISFLIEPLLLFGALKRLNTKRQQIENVFKFVGHVDMLVSVASLRNGLDTYCTPNIITADTIQADEMYHPLILNCTTNTMYTGDKSVLLTGSNMSGKTSFIRTIGLNVITGLTINTCFAKAISFPMLHVSSAIRISDDLMNDKSYYFEEVLTIKELINESSKNQKNLFLLDEIFKGTNTVERIAAGKSVLSLLAKNNNIVFVSTHDIELTDLLAHEYELYHFSETVIDDSVAFDYKLKEGKLKNRNAIRILEINNYPEEITSEAMHIAKKLDETYSVRTS